MEINKEFLQAVIHKLANQKQIFSNESQFQFNLAFLLEKELRNAFEKEQSSVDWEILLEEQTIEKEYADIVIRVGNLYYPIELKYKTCDTEVVYAKDGNEYKTYAQGAADNGCYDFLRDIMRLENIKAKKMRGRFTFEKGFAILITNYSLSWGIAKNGNKLKESNWSQFCLDGPKEKGTYKWNHKATSHDRVEDIKLNKKYDFHWLEYPHQCRVLDEKYEYPFRYVIEEV